MALGEWGALRPRSSFLDQSSLAASIKDILGAEGGRHQNPWQAGPPHFSLACRSPSCGPGRPAGVEEGPGGENKGVHEHEAQGGVGQPAGLEDVTVVIVQTSPGSLSSGLVAEAGNTHIIGADEHTEQIGLDIEGIGLPASF